MLGGYGYNKDCINVHNFLQLNLEVRGSLITFTISNKAYETGNKLFRPSS